MHVKGEQSESKVLSLVVSALENLESDTREKILRTVATFFDVGIGNSASHHPSHKPKYIPDAVIPSQNSSSGHVVEFSADMAPSPKQFLLDKLPHSDVERIACLAYYLTHYRDTPFFKTLDLSKINTDAAQPKFSNAAYSANNAVKQGYLAGATKGAKQLSAAGEQFVTALPDREAAKGAMVRARPKRKRLPNKKQKLNKLSK